MGGMSLQPWEIKQVGANERSGGGEGTLCGAGQAPEVSDGRGESRRAPPAEMSPPCHKGAHHSRVSSQVDKYSTCHHSAEFTVTVSIENMDSPADMSNFYGMLEVGKLWEPSVSAHLTTQLVSSLLRLGPLSSGPSLGWDSFRLPLRPGHPTEVSETSANILGRTPVLSEVSLSPKCISHRPLKIHPKITQGRMSPAAYK